MSFEMKDETLATLKGVLKRTMVTVKALNKHVKVIKTKLFIKLTRILFLCLYTKSLLN